MINKTEVKAESNTDTDRRQMREVLRKRLNKKLFFYLPPAVLGIGGLVLINTYDTRFDLTENVRGAWNLGLVLLAAFLLRLAISEIMSYNKDLSNFQIKWARGIIKNISGQTIEIGNYEFDLSAIHGIEVIAGDQIELKAGYTSSMAYWVEKAATISPPASSMA
jgi:hypothetical protein